MDKVQLSSKKVVNLTATSTSEAMAMTGFYVNSTTGGTIAFSDGAGAITGTITPAVGFHWFPYEFKTSVVATIGGTLNVTLFGN